MEAEQLSVEHAEPQFETLPPDDSPEPERPRTRKRRSDAGKARGPRSGTRKGSRSAPRTNKASAWLTKVEAQYLTTGLWFFLASRYGMVMQGVIFEPNDKAISHLAGFLQHLERIFPPFRMLQKLIGRVVPMADPNAKPGGSPVGDLVQYLYGWHEANPGGDPTPAGPRPALWEAAYYNDPAIPEIPFLPKNHTPQEEAYVTEQRPMSPEEYHEMMNGGGR